MTKKLGYKIEVFDKESILRQVFLLQSLQENNR
jgi:hypothetical protein